MDAFSLKGKKSGKVMGSKLAFGNGESDGKAGRSLSVERSCHTGLEQAHQALDTYFDFLKKSVSAIPLGGTELG